MSKKPNEKLVNIPVPYRYSWQHKVTFLTLQGILSITVVMLKEDETMEYYNGEK